MVSACLEGWKFSIMNFLMHDLIRSKLFFVRTHKNDMGVFHLKNMYCLILESISVILKATSLKMHGVL